MADTAVRPFNVPKFDIPEFVLNAPTAPAEDLPIEGVDPSVTQVLRTAREKAPSGPSNIDLIRLRLRRAREAKARGEPLPKYTFRSSFTAEEKEEAMKLLRGEGKTAPVEDAP